MGTEKNFEAAYPNLFSPITIKNTTFKNRIIAAPSGLSQAVTDNMSLRQDGIVCYGVRANGGAGMVTLSETLNDPTGKAHDCQFDMTNELILRPLHQFTDYLHFCGAKASLEVTHCGKWSLPEYIGRNPLGPSACINVNGSVVDEITRKDMDMLIAGFVNSAVMAKRAGFDACMIHGGHGWLLHQFLSPLDNQRQDEFGGSLENRARFPMMVLDAVRKAVGPDFILEYRMSTTELTEGGFGVDEAVEFIKMIEDKIDIVQASVGCRRDARTRAVMHPTHFLPNGCNVYLAEAMKRGGVKIPVTAIGAINDPELAERIIVEGKADFVAMVRSFIADFDWAEKARRNKADEIRPCIKCLHCLDVAAGRVGVSKVVAQNFTTASRKMECSVNPEFGREHMLHFYDRISCQAHKKVVVVGGGPAGITAALESAKKGNDVILFEKNATLGGQFTFANAGISFKQDAKRYLDYLVRMTEKQPNIEVRLNAEATPDLVCAERPDLVVIAVGAIASIPPIPGVDGANVYLAADAFHKHEELGDSVVIVGGGMVGCELALHLCEEGKRVHVIEMGNDLIPEGCFTERLHTLQFMEKEKGLTVTCGMRCTEITEDGVYAMDQDGNQVFLPAGSVVMATGMKPNKAVRDLFYGTAFDVVPIGDCVSIGNLVGATHSGWDVAHRY